MEQQQPSNGRGDAVSIRDAIESTFRAVERLITLQAEHIARQQAHIDRLYGELDRRDAFIRSMHIRAIDRSDKDFDA